MAAPEVSSFGDGNHSPGDTGITINGGNFGAFPGSVWVYRNSDRTGDEDELTVVSWNDIQIVVDLPGSLNNASGTRYLFVKHENLAWSNAVGFTLTIVAANLEEVLAAATVRPVYIAWFDIKDDPIRGWTGPGTFLPTSTGDSDLDDYTYESSQGAIDVSEIVENQSIGAEVTLSFAVSEDLPAFIVGVSRVGDRIGNPRGPVFDQLVIDRRHFLGREAVIWLGFLSSDDSAVLPEVERIFSGVMVGASTQRQSGQISTVTLTCDQDTQGAQLAPARLIDHQFFNSGDTATSYMLDVARGSTAGASQSHETTATPWRPPRRGRGGIGRWV